LGEAPKKKMLDVGELCIPELLDEMTDIFIDSEKLFTNIPN